MGDKCFPHPSLVPLLPPFLKWGFVQPPSHLRSSLSKAEQTLPWGSASPTRAYGAAHLQLSSLIIPQASLLAPLQSPSWSRHSQIPYPHPRLDSALTPPETGVGWKMLPCPVSFTPALLSTFPSFGSSDPTRGLKTVGACYLSLCLFDFLGVGEFHPHKLLHCVKKI